MHVLLAHLSTQSKQHLNRLSRFFAQLMSQCDRACWGMPFPLKIAPSIAGYGSPSNAWFLERT